MKRTRRILFTLAFQAVVILPLTGCNDRPKDILSEKEVVNILTDMRIAEAAFDTGQGSETGFPSKTAAQRGVLAKYGVTPEEYKRTMEWYGRNLDQYHKLWKDVDKKIERKIAAVDPNDAPSVNKENDVWPYPDHLIFTPGMLSDGLTFSIPDPAIDKGGYVEWKMKTADTFTGLSVLLGVDYDNGETSYISRMPSGFQDVNLRLQSDTAHVVKRLFGYVRPTTRLEKVLTIDSLTLVKMPYDSTEYYRISSQVTLRP